MKVTFNQIYAWVMSMSEEPRPDRHLVVPDHIMELGMSAYLQMWQVLDLRLKTCIEHVGISWSAVCYKDDTPPLRFTIKLSFPSGSPGEMVYSDTNWRIGVYSIEHAKLFGEKVAEMIAKAIEQDITSTTAKLSELQVGVTATLTAGTQQL